MNRKINKWVIVVSIGLFIIFSLLTFVCNAYITDTAWKILLNTIFSSLASISGVALLWELIAKKSFSNDLYQMIQISSNLQDSGIENIYFYRDVDWGNELKKTKSLKIFFAYGSTFRKNHMDELKKIDNLVVYLPNLEDEKIVDNLDYRFCYGSYSSKKEESVNKKIFDAICEFKEWGAKVYLHNMIHAHTLYELDKCCIFANYKHSRSRGNVLTLKANKSGAIYKFVNEEFESIQNNSEEVNEECLQKLKIKFLGSENG